MWMIPYIFALSASLLLYSLLLLAFREPPGNLPKPQARAIVTNWPLGWVGKRR